MHHEKMANPEFSTNNFFNIIGSGESKEDNGANIQKEETLWSVFHRLKAVLETPLDDTSPRKTRSGYSSESSKHASSSGSRCGRSGGGGGRVHHEVIYDDSKRVVDMTEIQPNLFIGDG